MILQNLVTHDSRNIKTVMDNITIYDVADIIFKQGLSSVLVLNKAKKSIGIVTEQDVVLAIKTFKQKILELKITEIMSVDLMACHPDEAIDEAVRVMGAYKIRNLPIITESGNLSGFIDLNTIARAQLSHIIQRWG
ncbi:MAG: histidine kinase [Magnetococcales bacterium]|nr:histidine kinase [Magnetococcales bacterium]|tara:strand:+ start:103 stop:510 length:408 start_codon:yes stop_codon:yes gene_type:complete